PGSDFRRWVWITIAPFVTQWAIRADVPCRVTTFSPDVKCARQKERFASKLSQDTTSPPHPGRS
ncbi:hypothetical protein Q0T17_24750, partial [Escherichia coli O4:H5]